MRILSRVVSLFFLLIAFSIQTNLSLAQQNLNGQAANPLDVVINEVAWMGSVPKTGESIREAANNEWIELYNNTNKDINLEGWILKAADDAPKINLAGIIPTKGFYLLERTDDNSLPGIPANQIYKGALRNDGENLKIYDNFGNLIDSVNCSEGWFDGDGSTKQTMERLNSLLISNINNWGTSQNPGGTPKAPNIIVAQRVEFQPQKDAPTEVRPPQATPQRIESSEKGLAAVAEPFKQGSVGGEIPKSLSISLIALTIAILSAVIILFLKRKLKTKELL